MPLLEQSKSTGSRVFISSIDPDFGIENIELPAQKNKTAMITFKF